MINKDLFLEGDINCFKVYERLWSLNVSIVSEFDNIKNIIMNIFICNVCFLGLVVIVSVFLIVMIIKLECVWIFYFVFFLIVCSLLKILFLRIDLYMKYLYIKF